MALSHESCLCSVSPLQICVIKGPKGDLCRIGWPPKTPRPYLSLETRFAPFKVDMCPHSPNSAKLPKSCGHGTRQSSNLKPKPRSRKRRTAATSSALSTTRNTSRQRFAPSLATRISNRNAGQKIERVLSVTNSAGFVLAEDQFAPSHRLRRPLALQDRSTRPIRL